MAVVLTGDETHFNNSTQDGNNAYTIASDAEAVIVFGRGTFATSVANDYDELNWDNGATLDFTAIVVQSDTGTTDDMWAYIMTNTDGNWPGTGAKTLYFSLSGTLVSGIIHTVLGVKGLNTTTPVRDTDKAGDATQTWTASLSGVVTGDLTIIARCDYGSTADITHGSGQVEIDDDVFNDSRSGLSRKDGEGAPEISSSNDTTYDGNIAFALAQAVAGGANPKGPLGMPLFGALRGPI